MEPKRDTMTVAINHSVKNQQFETGAERGIEPGRGQASLLPWHALDFIARLYGGWGRMPVDAMDALAKLYEAGAIKYSARNWEKGIPIDAYINSAWRHYRKFRKGYTDEPHCVQFAWNALCMFQTHIWIESGKLDSKLQTLPRVGLSKEYNLASNSLLQGAEEINVTVDAAFQGLVDYIVGDGNGLLRFAAFAIATLELSLAETENDTTT